MNTNPKDMTIEELEIFISKYPRNSACRRADVLMFEQLLERKKLEAEQVQQNSLSLNLT